MAYQTLEVTSTPIDIASTLSLVARRRYLVDVVPPGPGARFFAGGDSAPSDPSFYVVVPSGAPREFLIWPVAGAVVAGLAPTEALWAWALFGSVRLVVSPVST